MALQYFLGTKSFPQTISLRIIGDGSSTVINIPLFRAPVFDAANQGNTLSNVPAGVALVNGSGVTLTLSATKDVVTVTFTVAPAAGSTNLIEIALMYNGV